MDRVTAGLGRRSRLFGRVVPLALAATTAVLAAACDAGDDSTTEPVPSPAPPTTAGTAGPYRYEIELRFGPGDPLHDQRGACWTVTLPDGTSIDLSSSYESADASPRPIGSEDEQGRSFTCPAVAHIGPGPEYLAVTTESDLGDTARVTACVFGGRRCTEADAHRVAAGSGAAKSVSPGIVGLDGEVWAIDGEGALAEVYERLAPISGFVGGSTLWLDTTCRPLGLVTSDGTITEFVEGTEVECDGPEDHAAYDLFRTLPGASIERDGDTVAIASDDGALTFTVIAERDRVEILTAAALHRVTVDNSFGRDVFDVVHVTEIVGRTSSDGHIVFDPDSRELSAAERDALTALFAPRPVTFVGPHWPGTPEDADLLLAAADAAVLDLTDPVVVDGEVRITSQISCGSLCGIGGANMVEHLDDGTWRVGRPVGPQWVA